MSDLYDDGGRGKSVAIPPEMLPPADPRLTGRQPVTEPPPAQDRYPQTGQFR